MPEISEVEKEQRRLAVESTIGTHAMEGIQLDAGVRRVLNAFADGELTLEQFSAAMDHYASATLAQTHPLRGAA